MANQFDSIFIRKPKRNKFNLSFNNKFTAPFGALVPFMVQDVIPGDRFKIGSRHVIRLQPTVAPIMHNIHINKHYFFVPNRLIWKDWEDFITGGELGMSNLHVPFIHTSSSAAGNNPAFFHAGSLSDYLGFPSIDAQNGYNDTNYRIDFHALPFAAYQLIWQEYYRDQNITTELSTQFPLEISGAINQTQMISDLCTLRFKAWKKDEFTSALPWAQRGPNVLMPFDVNISNGDVTFNNNGVASKVYSVSGGEANGVTLGVRNGDLYEVGGFDSSLSLDNSKNLQTNVSATTGNTTILELRRSMAVQNFLEAMARGGSRYIEQIRSIFGVKSSDGRLQRPLYLGGTSTPLVMTETAQTSQTTSDAVQGNLSGNGASVTSDYVFSRGFEEHGLIIGIMSVIPDASYFQGVPQKYLRHVNTDYYWPQFAHIGEQAIQKQRLFRDFTRDDDSQENVETFGYEPRYAEYRFNNDEIHGEFRTNLKQWHLAREWSATSKPDLNRSFIEVQPSVADNIFSVDAFKAHPLLCSFDNAIVASRLISKYGTPYIQ